MYHHHADFKYCHHDYYDYRDNIITHYYDNYNHHDNNITHDYDNCNLHYNNQYNHVRA